MDRFNRERFGVLNKETYWALKNMAELRQKHPDEKVIGKNDFVESMHDLFKDQWENRFNEKIYLFTKSTVKKLEGMDVRPLIGEIEKIEPILKDEDRGYIVIPKERYNFLDDVSAYYVVKDGKFLMHICCGEHKIGYVVADRDYSPYVEVLPWSLITMLYKKKFCHHSEMVPMEGMFEGLLADFPSLRDGDVEPIFKILNGNKKKINAFVEKHPKSKPAISMHGFAFARVIFAFTAFIFLKTSEIYTKTYIPDNTPTALRKKNFRPLNYIQVDATWDMNIDVNTPFLVRGHFVNQPCKKDGEWTRKLIFVEQYMKKGYHRRAKKIIKQEKQN